MRRKKPAALARRSQRQRQGAPCRWMQPAVKAAKRPVAPVAGSGRRCFALRPVGRLRRIGMRPPRSFGPAAASRRAPAVSEGMALS